MTIWEFFAENPGQVWQILLITLLPSVLPGIAAAFSSIVAWRKVGVEAKAVKPEAVAHLCRISEFQVYTFVDQQGHHTESLCPFLHMEDESPMCLYQPEMGVWIGNKLHMKKVNDDKCYLALWAKRQSRG